MNDNKMGVMPINKLLISMGFPMMLSMLVQALYNIVDSIFVAKISEDALTALSLAFPMQNLIIAISVGIGVGMNALLSKSLGEKNKTLADQSAIQGIILEFFAFLIFLIIGVFLVPAFIKLQTDNVNIIEYGITYLRICCILSLGIFMQISFERMLQSTGKTHLAMICQLTGAVTNIILDPILIFGLLGFPAMGVAGAAYATVIGQFFAAICGYLLNKHYNKEITVKISNAMPNLKVIRKILSVGIPSAVMASIGSVMTFGMNKILMSLTSTAVAVFGVYFKLQSFIFMPVFGLNNAMVPIVAYNFGARNKERIMKTIKFSVIYAVSIMFIGFLIFTFLPEQLLHMFDASEDMLKIGCSALRTISLSFVFAGYCIMITSVFQAFGNGIYSMFTSITRQLIVLLPVAYLLSFTKNVNMIWYSFPIAEISSLILCTLFMIKIYNKHIRNM